MDSTIRSWDSASQGVLTTKSFLLMDQMIGGKFPQFFRLIRVLGIMGLDECLSKFGESKEISQYLNMDSTSCSYNSVSHRLDTFL